MSDRADDRKIVADSEGGFLFDQDIGISRRMKSVEINAVVERVNFARVDYSVLGQERFGLVRICDHTIGHSIQDTFYGPAVAIVEESQASDAVDDDRNTASSGNDGSDHGCCKHDILDDVKFLLADQPDKPMKPEGNLAQAVAYDDDPNTISPQLVDVSALAGQ